MKTREDLDREEKEFIEQEVCLSVLNGMIGIIFYFLNWCENIAPDKIEKLNDILKLLYHERNMFYTGDIDIRAKCYGKYGPAIKQFHLNFKTGEVNLNDTLKIFG
jgi:hypothetical protein